MCGVLALLFIAIPAVEILVIIKVGSVLGVAATIAVIFATGIAGAALARHQGLAAMRRVQLALLRGEQIGGSLVEGALVLCAGCLLLTPGFVTDAVGFALLVPPVRHRVGGVIAARLAARAQARIAIGFGPGAARPGPDRSPQPAGDGGRGPARPGNDPHPGEPPRTPRDNDPPPPGVIDV